MKNRAQILFGAVDLFLTPLQNLRRFPHITRIKDIPYDVSCDRLKLDVLYKEGEKDVLKPVVIYYAGGGFIGGSKNFRQSTLRFMASQGYAVIGANHRLAPKYNFPVPVQDCYAALNFLPQIAKEYNLDLSRIIVAGDSSGGYLASYCLAAVNSAELRARLSLPEPTVQPFGFIGWCGVYDVKQMISAKVPLGLARVTGDSFLGIKLKKDFSNFPDYEYIDCITPLDFITEKWVPTYFNYSKLDLFCRGQGEIFLALMEKVGQPYMYSHTTNFIENHDYQLFAFNPHSGKALRDTAEYLRQMKEYGTIRTLPEDVTGAIPTAVSTEDGPSDAAISAEEEA